MRALVLLLFSLGFFSGAGAQDLRRPPTPADRARIIADGWAKSRDSLGAALSAAYQPGGPERPGSTGVTSYREWMLLWKWCELLSRTEKGEAAKLFAQNARFAPGEQERATVFPPGHEPPEEFTPVSQAIVDKVMASPSASQQFLSHLLAPEFTTPSDQPLATALKPEILAEWINDETISLLLFQNLDVRDYAPAVLKSLEEIWQADAVKFREYAALAVALALVYDQKTALYWPHHQVDPKLVPFHDESIMDRFNFWVKSNESRSLLLDLRKLGPAQIKFIVDAPIDESEFDWARKNVKYNRTDFAKAFSSVSYNFARYKAGNYVWTEEPYTLLNIRQHGGICVDQAYYASVVGKAKGLPTLLFSGQGTDGGHAWFGYMKADDKWELDCGRYLNQNYAIGEAMDPQTWHTISDHDLEFLAQRFREKLEFAASQDDILMAGNFEKQGDAAKALKAYDSAISVCPKNVDAWDAKGDFLNRSKATAEIRRAHYDAAAKQFVTDRDIKSRQLESLAGVLRELGDTQGATALERQIVSQNKHKRSDLSINMVAQQLDGLVADKKFDDAFKVYRQQIMALGKTGGGNFFNDVVVPFVSALVEAGDNKRAKDASDLAYKALHPEPDSILEREFKDLEKRIRGEPKK
ncbi:hypothetical protein BH09VER1_BH09VER1_26780 [soil metagenome]